MALSLLVLSAVVSSAFAGGLLGASHPFGAGPFAGSPFFGTGFGAFGKPLVNALGKVPVGADPVAVNGFAPLVASNHVARVLPVAGKGPVGVLPVTPNGFAFAAQPAFGQSAIVPAALEVSAKEVGLGTFLPANAFANGFVSPVGGAVVTPVLANAKPLVAAQGLNLAFNSPLATKPVGVAGAPVLAANGLVFNAPLAAKPVGANGLVFNAPLAKGFASPFFG